jgi:hypothetical protein
MTPDLLALIEESKRLDSAATEGPWVAEHCPGDADGRLRYIKKPGRFATVARVELPQIEEYEIDGGPKVCWSKCNQIMNANSQFIAHSRTALPALVAEVERLQRVVDQAVAFTEVSTREDAPPGLVENPCVLRDYYIDEHPDLYAELKAREGR